MRSFECKIWAFDFDGTLSHLVPNRNAAKLDPECEALLVDLASDPNQVVAIVSSRSLEDLKSRVSLENVVLAGASGLEWWLPGNQRLGPNDQAVERLKTERKRLLPSLRSVAKIPGVELEDKTWSTAIHFRRVAQENRIVVERDLEKLHRQHGVVLHYGADVAELQYLQEVSKELAAKTLVTLFAPRQTGRNLLFAGDDQNDAEAMRWILARGGSAYVVGDRVNVDGARVVASPTELARALRRRFPWIGNVQNSNEMEGSND
jgi:trehalose 6-phosphate phosphatase